MYVEHRVEAQVRDSAPTPLEAACRTSDAVTLQEGSDESAPGCDRFSVASAAHLHVAVSPS